MKRDEALQHFHQHYVEPQIKDSLAEVGLYLNNNYQELEQDLLQAFLRLCRTITARQTAGNKGPIAYLYGSFLYTSLCLEQSVYRLDAYTHEWFLDPQECAVYYDAGWAFQYLHGVCGQLALDSKSYAGLITRYDIDLIKRQAAEHYSAYIEALGAGIMDELFASPDFQSMEKSDELTVYMGEYKDQCQETGVYHRPRKETCSCNISSSAVVTMPEAWT